jgi:hypothetical protein
LQKKFSSNANEELLNYCESDPTTKNDNNWNF